MLSKAKRKPNFEEKLAKEKAGEISGATEGVSMKLSAEENIWLLTDAENASTSPLSADRRRHHES